jgi:uncharacterized protein YbjT (DUF2867 family)
MKVIVTGATGMVGEGILLECLNHAHVEQVLMVNRRHYDISHPKLKELIAPDFFKIEDFAADITGYDACFFCAGISSVGLNKQQYTHITYDTTIAFAGVLVKHNPEMTFCFISGASTNENGKAMWARVKGHTESALMKMDFKNEYNFRPGMMKPSEGQKNIKPFYKIITWTYPFFAMIMPGATSTLHALGLAMINSVLKGSPKQILEVKDIKELAGRS